MAITQQYTRASRDYEFVPGQGGAMGVQRYSTAGIISTNAVTLDIKEWVTIETYRNQNTTNSGSSGPDPWTRVGSAWVWAATLDFPGRLAATSEEQGDDGLATNFVDELLGSLKSVVLQFYCGDPLWWEARGLDPLSYYGRGLLEEVKTVCTPNTEGGGKVIGLNVSGVGNSFLLKMVRNTPLNASLWQ